MIGSLVWRLLWRVRDRGSVSADASERRDLAYSALCIAVLSALAVVGLIAAGVSIPQLFLLTGVATLGVAALFWRLRGALVRRVGAMDIVDFIT